MRCRNGEVPPEADRRVNVALEAVVKRLDEHWSRVDPRRVTLALGPLVHRSANGSVFKGTYDGTAMAVKQLIVQGGSSALSTQQLRQIELLRHCKHPNVIHIIGTCPPPLAFVVTRRCPAGDLGCAIAAAGSALPLRVTFLISIGVTDALEFLHARNLVHRDIKPSNILLAMPLAEVARAEAYTIPCVLSDFGAAQPSSASTMTRGVGTPAYVAPEVLLNQPYGLPADVYSLGMTLYEMLTGKPPFSDLSGPMQICMRLSQGGRPELPASMHPILGTMLAGMWRQEAPLRPPASEVRAALVDASSPFIMSGSPVAASSSEEGAGVASSSAVAFLPVGGVRADLQSGTLDLRRLSDGDMQHFAMSDALGNGRDCKRSIAYLTIIQGCVRKVVFERHTHRVATFSAARASILAWLCEALGVSAEEVRARDLWRTNDWESYCGSPLGGKIHMEIFFEWRGVMHVPLIVSLCNSGTVQKFESSIPLHHSMRQQEYLQAATRAFSHFPELVASGGATQEAGRIARRFRHSLPASLRNCLYSGVWPPTIVVRSTRRPAACRARCGRTSGCGSTKRSSGTTRMPGWAVTTAAATPTATLPPGATRSTRTPGGSCATSANRRPLRESGLPLL
jgi:serine/threonine protein kinase